MPAPAAPRPSPFLDRLVRFLIPYFLTITPDLDTARKEVLETLASYGARTRSEMINAARIIAFGFSALDVLAEAKAMEKEMPPNQKLRYRGCANSLNRSCLQNEKTLAQRLASELPDAPQPAAEPTNDIPDEQAAEILRQAQATINTCRDRLSGARPNLPRQDRHQLMSNSAIMRALSGQRTLNQPAPAA